jgi:hypothetical protein
MRSVERDGDEVGLVEAEVSGRIGVFDDEAELFRELGEPLNVVGPL